MRYMAPAPIHHHFVPEGLAFAGVRYVVRIRLATGCGPPPGAERLPCLDGASLVMSAGGVS